MISVLRNGALSNTPWRTKTLTTLGRKVGPLEPHRGQFALVFQLQGLGAGVPGDTAECHADWRRIGGEDPFGTDGLAPGGERSDRWLQTAAMIQEVSSCARGGKEGSKEAAEGPKRSRTATPE